MSDIGRFNIECVCDKWRYHQHARGAWVKIDSHNEAITRLESALAAEREKVTALADRVRGLEGAAQRFHDQVHDIAGTGYMSWRALLQERCAEFRAAITPPTTCEFRPPTRPSWASGLCSVQPVTDGNGMEVITPPAPQQEKHKSTCMGCLGSGIMEGYGKCPTCKGEGTTPPAPAVSKKPSIYDNNPACQRCKDTPSAGDGAWRMADGVWQHRCSDLHPQVGYEACPPGYLAPAKAPREGDEQ